MNSNIPVYRAKRINSDEWVEGWLRHNPLYSEDCRYEIEVVSASRLFRVDPKTLAIHFGKHSKNNKSKVFFSLQDDGGGGDLVDYGFDTYYAQWNNMQDKCEFVNINDELDRLNTMANVEIIGTYKETP